MQLTKPLIFAALLVIGVSGEATADSITASLQCQEPRQDIFTYSDGKASGSEERTDGSFRPRQYDLVGFDPDLLKGVFYTISRPANAVGLITVFEINFANPAVTEHRIGPDVNVKFSFKGCRRIT
jgi:hypothetical protein